jgi:hypothetical protein
MMGGTMRLRTSLLILGTALLVGSIGLWFSVKTALDDGASKAKALESGMFFPGLPQPCNGPSWHVAIGKNVISENETVSLRVSLISQDPKMACEETVDLTAPGFDVSPNALTRTFLISPAGTVSLIWLLEPKRLGTFPVAVELSNPASFQQVGITVPNIFGLTIWQAQLLSSVGTFLGTFFGPILSFTWWYTVWKKRRKKMHSRTSPTAPSATQTPQGPIGKLLDNKRKSNKSSTPDN